MISGGPKVTFVASHLHSKAHPRRRGSKKIFGDTHEIEQTARADRAMRTRELMLKVRVVALDMSVDRTPMGLTGAHTLTTKIFTVEQGGEGQAMDTTILSKHMEDQCIDRGFWKGV